MTTERKPFLQRILRMDRSSRLTVEKTITSIRAARAAEEARTTAIEKQTAKLVQATNENGLTRKLRAGFQRRIEQA